MERVFAATLPLDSLLHLSVRQWSFSAQPLYAIKGATPYLATQTSFG
jgi:hypothetical protein